MYVCHIFDQICNRTNGREIQMAELLVAGLNSKTSPEARGGILLIPLRLR